MASNSHDVLPNTTRRIGKYAYVEPPIGQGTYGKVHLGKDTERNELVAIKIISRENYSTSYNEKVPEAGEIAILKSLRHENVVSLFDVIVNDFYVYIIMEYCPGSDLGEYLRTKGALPEVTIRRFAKQIVSALEAFKSAGIVHRDIKPENILIWHKPSITDPISKDLVLKFADFGLSKKLPEGQLATTQRIGSPIYMAPEVYLGSANYDQRADHFSTGVVFYKLFTGRYPYKLEDRYRNPRLVIPAEASKHFADFLRRLLETDPEKRMTLEELKNHPFLCEPSPGSSPEPSPPRKVRKMSWSEIQEFSETDPISFLEQNKSHLRNEYKTTEVFVKGIKIYQTTLEFDKVVYTGDKKKDKAESKKSAAAKLIGSIGFENLLRRDVRPDAFKLFHPPSIKPKNTFDVLISGLGGLGVEIAKNLILDGGVRSVTLHDVAPCQASDLATQFYISEGDLGKNRAEVCLKHLSERNTFVHVETSTNQLSKTYLKRFRGVVLTDSNLEEKKRVAEIVHSLGHAMIVAQTRGLCAQLFCDFGPDFTVIDTEGENPISAMISGVSKEEEGIVTCLDETRHGLETGDYVYFSDVQGMVELNGCQPRPIKVLDPYTFSIGDTTGFTDYVGGGIVTQVKKVQFKPFAQALDEPEFLDTDSENLNRQAQLHLAFRALDAWMKNKEHLPNPWSRSDSATFLKVAQEVNGIAEGAAKVEKINEDLLSTFAHVCRGTLNPIDATIGGIVAQEVMKACTKKGSPIVQWFYFDAFDCLPENCDNLSEEECKSTGSRYDGQIAVFGSDFQKKLGSLHYFLNGTGPLGSEILKNLAMLGVGAGEGGHVYVTDTNRIEKSYQPQFLFRRWDVQKSKSRTAAAAVKAMNPNLNITAFEKRVGLETENFFDDEFFGKLHGVVNALDNVDARMYMNRRCVYYRKSLLEPGTLGTKGNVQVVIPDLTETYCSPQDPPQKAIPISMPTSYPTAIQQTLQWSLDMFERLFRQSVESAARHLVDPKFMDRTLKLAGSMPLLTLEAVKKALVDDRPANFQACVKWARLHWEEQFHNKITQLLFDFPPDQLISGQPFWPGPTRCPHPLNFDVNDQVHLDYVVAAANLKAQIYGIPQTRDRQAIAAMVADIVVDKFVPRTGVPIAGYDAEGASAVMLQTEILSASSLPELSIRPLEFKKDDDSNFHMDFIVASSNLRAANYGIAPATRQESKMIVGEFISTIATTTSVVSGLACLELLKLTQGHKKLESFKNAFVNLALPLFGFSYPIAAPKLKYNKQEWTPWDRFKVKGEMTLRELLLYLEEHHELKKATLSHENRLLYAFHWPASKRNARMDLLMSEVVELEFNKRLEPHVKALVFKLRCRDSEDEDIEVPNVHYVLPTV